jgi:hypothetical protein
MARALSKEMVNEFSTDFEMAFPDKKGIKAHTLIPFVGLF